MVQTKRSRKSRDFSTVHPAAAAIDIGATIHVAAVGPDRDMEPVRTFRTFTDDLHRLADWFAGCGIKTVVMESTGVYWIPVFEILEQRGFEVMVVNARDAKHVPGRKTNVSDAQWLQRLHEYGLLRASFRPGPKSPDCAPTFGSGSGSWKATMPLSPLARKDGTSSSMTQTGSDQSGIETGHVSMFRRIGIIRARRRRAGHSHAARC